MRATCLRTHHHLINEKSFKIALNLQKKRPNSPTQLGENPLFYPPAPSVVDTSPPVRTKPGARRIMDRPGAGITAMDEAGSWNNLHEQFEVKRINHEEALFDGRRLPQLGGGIFLAYAPRGIHHHIADLLRYAQDSSWREDNRRLRASQPPRGFVFEAWQVS